MKQLVQEEIDVTNETKGQTINRKIQNKYIHSFWILI